MPVVKLRRLDVWLEVVWWVAAALSVLCAWLAFRQLRLWEDGQDVSDAGDAWAVGFSQLTLWVIAGWVLLVVWLVRSFRRLGVQRRAAVWGWFLSVVSIPVEHRVLADLARRTDRPGAVRWVWVWSASLTAGVVLFLVSAISALTFTGGRSTTRVEYWALTLTMVASAIACVALIQYVRSVRAATAAT